MGDSSAGEAAARLIAEAVVSRTFDSSGAWNVNDALGPGLGAGLGVRMRTDMADTCLSIIALFSIFSPMCRGDCPVTCT